MVTKQDSKPRWKSRGFSNKKMAQLNSPHGVFVSGGEVYIADTENHRVRKVLRNGEIVTIAGTGILGCKGDGQLATDAHLHGPCSVVVSSSDQVYILELHGHRIRKIDQRGIISTIAGTGQAGYNGDDQLAVNAMINYPCGLFVTEDEEVLFADSSNGRVRKIDRNGIISTIAGNGKRVFVDEDQLATSASLHSPSCVFQYMNEIYLAETFHKKIRKIDQNGIMSIIAGKKGYGTLENGAIGGVYSIFVHNYQVYFSEHENHQIRIIQPNGGIKKVAGIENARGFMGDDRSAMHCTLDEPRGIFVDEDSQVYIADTSNHCIRKIDRNGKIRRVIGTGNYGYSGDVPFEFHKYPHIGPRKKPIIKPFPHAYHDLFISVQN